MEENKGKKNPPITSSSPEGREEAWDDLYATEEVIVVSFDFDTRTGQVRSLRDDTLYDVDHREPMRTRIELRPGVKVFFAPFEAPEGRDFARISSKRPENQLGHILACLWESPQKKIFKINNRNTH